MATDIVAQLADSLAKTGVEDGELSYKGQGRKLDDAQSGECQLSLSANKPLVLRFMVASQFELPSHSILPCLFLSL